MAPDRRKHYPGAMNSPSRLRFLSILLIASLVALAGVGCQTSKGFGKDVEKLGDKIQDKASR
jgi:predicted small secreted protein